MSLVVELGDVVDVLRGHPDNSFDAVLCDPPYGLSFMGKRWDYDVPSVELWAEVLRVLKPGAALIVFGGTRTYHRMVVNVEDAGFEIRDQINWLYGSGFPKSLDVSKALDKEAGAVREVVGPSPRAAQQTPKRGTTALGDFAGVGDLTAPATDAAREWSGYGTALKPACEPAVLARKPLDGTVAANVAKWGVGALAIDACRIGTEGGGTSCMNRDESGKCRGHRNAGRSTSGETFHGPDTSGGRWPANVILDEEAGAMLDEQTGERPSTLTGRADPNGRHTHPADPSRERGSMFGNVRAGGAVYADSGGASRFFYCAKASKRERGEGNTHPTVKPLAICEYLARLIMPPKPGRILVPFAGSGSEMIGARRAGWPAVVGIERESAYVEIAQRRAGAA